MTKLTTLFGAMLLILVIAGCSASSEEAPPVDNEPSPQPEEEPEQASPTNTPLPAAQPADEGSSVTDGDPVVALAVADLAQRLDIAAESVEVVSAEEVTWPDGSLGCPQPGQDYTQALEEGMLIELRANEITYPYHTGSDGLPFLCVQLELETPIPLAASGAAGVTPQAPPTRGEDLPVAAPVVERALADLSSRLGIAPDAIEVLLAENVVWSDSALGCPLPGMMYTQVLTEGMRVILNVNGQLYFYHSGRSGEPFLCGTPGKLGTPIDEFLPPPGGPDT